MPLCRKRHQSEENESGGIRQYPLAQGSFDLQCLLVEAATNCFISKPVGLDGGAMMTGRNQSLRRVLAVGRV